MYKPTLHDVLRMEGIQFVVKRNDQADRTERGICFPVSEKGEGYISFLPDVDVQEGDTLIDPCGQKFPVLETKIQFVQGSPFKRDAYYKQREDKQAASSTVYNIQTVNGPIMSGNSSATIQYNPVIQEMRERVSAENSPDRAEMDQIVSLLEKILDNQAPPSQGMLSKFSAVMERHSWLTSSFLGALFSWLTGKIPSS